MPYPHNYDTAVKVEEIIESNGAVPATIAIMNGFMHVGLSRSEIEYLSDPSNASSIVKTSRRDISRVLSSKASGATTVSGTMFIAHLAGTD